MKKLTSLNVGKSLNRNEMKAIVAGRNQLIDADAGCGSACTKQSSNCACVWNVPGCGSGGTCL